MKKEFYNYSMIVLGSIIYAISTAAFIFPHRVLLGGTGGISVILNEYLPFSPGMILFIINFILLVIAFIVLGEEMGTKTFIGSTLTSVFISTFEKMPCVGLISISDVYLSCAVGRFL